MKIRKKICTDRKIAGIYEHPADYKYTECNPSAAPPSPEWNNAFRIFKRASYKTLRKCDTSAFETVTSVTERGRAERNISFSRWEVRLFPFFSLIRRARGRREKLPERTYKKCVRIRPRYYFSGANVPSKRRPQTRLMEYNDKRTKKTNKKKQNKTRPK